MIATGSRLQDVQALIARALLRARELRTPVLASYAERADGIAPLDLYAAGLAAGVECAFWQRPSERFCLVGVGVAHEIAGSGEHRFASVEQDWRTLVACAHIEACDGVGPIAIGGFAFDVSRPATPLWRGFGDGRMIVPRLTLLQRGEEAWVVLNAIVAPDTDPEAAARQLAGALARARGTAVVATRPPNAENAVEDLLPSDEWQHIVGAAAAAVREGRLAKVVLARAVRAVGAVPADPVTVVGRLAASYPTCTVFALGDVQACFVGATPERLVDVRAGEMRVSCLAGTVSRGKTPQEDQLLGRGLLESSKDRDEHAIVVEMLQGILAEECANLYAPSAPTLMKMRNLQHLYTPFTGRLAESSSLLRLVERLHPTPAVGGVPRDSAMAYIRDHERLDRGWYAGPLGWMDTAGGGDFAVGLRSGVLRDGEAVLFAGCGIVGDSDPAGEHAESVLKLRPMLSALRGDTE